MTATEPSPEYYGLFDEVFLQRVHQLIFWGYSDARSRIKQGSNEPEITGFIVEAIRKRRQRMNRPRWVAFFSVTEQMPQSADGETGTGRPIIDIVIEKSGALGCPEFIFEAKRLYRPGFLESKYTGEGGLRGSFLSGHYARRYDQVGMLGYVQNETVTEWKTNLQNRINKYKTPLALIGAQTPEKFHPKFKHEWASRHSRPAIGRDIVIYHLLVDCT